MQEKTNGLGQNIVSGTVQAQDSSWTIGPREFVLKYLRYLPWVFICTAFALVFAYIKIRYTTPIFHVQSFLLIKDDKGNNLSKDQKLDELFMSQGVVNLSNEIQILKSSPVIQRVVKDLNFQTRYYGTGKIRSSLLYPQSPVLLQIIHIADSSVGFGISITVLNDNQFTIGVSKTPVSFGQIIDKGGNQYIITRNKSVDLHGYASNIFRINWSPLPEAASGIIRSIKVAAPSDQSTILTLSFDGENSNLGRDVLNTMMSVYDTLIVEDKRRISVSTSDFIDTRLDTLKQQLGGQEGRMKDFMSRNNAFDIDDQSKKYVDNIFEANKNITAEEVRINIIDWMLQYIRDNRNVYKLVPTNLDVNEPVLVKLVTEYNTLQQSRETNLKTTTPNNPVILTIEGTLEKVRRDIAEALESVKKAHQIALNDMMRQSGLMQGELKTLPGKSMEMINIQRQQKILEELYSFLLNKKIETSISTVSTFSNSKVIEPAFSSNYPITPDKKSIYTLYTLFGIMIPIGIIAVFELLRDKISNRVDVEKRTNAPIIGEIGHSDDQQTLVVKKNSRRFISEQFRIIRSNLQYVITKKEKSVILVTSSFSGEGKSFISTNIAAVMSISGKKTVIMEFDIRKPKIVTGLELKSKMGITNYIIGRAKFQDIILPVEGMENLFVIPCGPIPPNPSELLLDNKLDELMKEVIEHFDVVVMDTAPVGLVSDAINLSRFADCTLYIIRQGHTFRKQLRLIDELYTEKKLPSISLLLNDVKAEGAYYSGYYGEYGYYGGYSYGYESGYFEAEPKKTNKTFWRQATRWWRQWFR